MLLAKFAYLCKELAQDRHVQDLGGSLTIYRQSGDCWVSSDKHEKIDEVTESIITASLSKKDSWKAVGSKRVFFYIEEFECSLSIIFAKLPSQKSRIRARRVIDECVARSKALYRANHHDLTGLPNREVFDRAATEELSKMKHPIEEIIPDRDGGRIVSAVAILAVDIDYFKQINDNNGHLYGDLVLRALSRRLSIVSREYSEERRVLVLPAHPSGEEFLFLVSGVFAHDVEKELGERLRQAVCAQPLPSDDELAIFKSIVSVSSINVPVIANRQVTISLGFSTTRDIAASDRSQEIIVMLKGRADTALYRAKASGRNMIVGYNEILSRYGRVIAHHESTGIVTIDIGRNVGVKEGQDFLVYHPDFSGDKEFYTNDGRSIRKLGVYPRISSARIEAFEVQEEISFCKIRASSFSNLLPQGSLLKAVALGSIGHLLSQVEGSQLDLLRVGDLEARISAGVRDEKDFFSVAIEISNAESLLESRGIAFINKLVADLYTTMRREMPKAIHVAQIEKMQIGLAGPDNSCPTDMRLNQVMEKFEESTAGVVMLRAGIYSVRDGEKFKDSKYFMGYPEIKREGCLRLAQFALMNPARNSERLTRFSQYTGNQVLMHSLSSVGISGVESDYEVLKEFNAINALTENRLALCYYAMGNHDKSSEIYGELFDNIHYQKNDYMIALNYAIMLMMNDEKEKFIKFIIMGLASSNVKNITDIYIEYFGPYITKIIHDTNQQAWTNLPVVEFSDVLERFLLLDSDRISAEMRLRAREALEFLKMIR